jgi:hypothetical protein
MASVMQTALFQRAHLVVQIQIVVVELAVTEEM